MKLMLVFFRLQSAQSFLPSPSNSIIVAQNDRIADFNITEQYC